MSSTGSSTSPSGEPFPEHPQQVQEDSQLWTSTKNSWVYRFYENVILPNVGCSLLVLSQFFNSIMVTTCKLLVTDKEFTTPIHPLQILFVRMIITYACCLIYMYTTKSVPDYPFGPKEIRKLLVLRGIVGFFGVFGLYFSLQYLSLSDAVAITFLIPMVTAFLAWVVIHEHYTLIEAVCGLISLGGVVLIAKPHFIFGSTSDSETSIDENIESSSTEKRLLATAVGLMGVCGASSVFIILRKIGKRAHPLLSVSYFAAICVVLTFTLLLIIPSLSFAIPQNGHQWFLFFLIGISGFLMQFSLTAGVQREKAGRAALMTYSNMIFAIIWDLVIWGHLPGILSFLGIFLIIGMAGVMIVYKPKEAMPPTDIENGASSAEYKELGTPGSDDISLDNFIISDEEEEESSDQVDNKATQHNT
ncbi:hypothetical protein CAAN1_08S05050 [[Candida] anglica]|uniref:EamA domain-containing protein n=1 Tax=[Candida] anglica TaxID=148631 RepID=A0ABP0E5K5_9ASCO